MNVADRKKLSLIRAEFGAACWKGCRQRLRSAQQLRIGSQRSADANPRPANGGVSN